MSMSNIRAPSSVIVHPTPTMSAFEECSKYNDPTPGLRKPSISKLESILSGKAGSAFTPIDETSKKILRQRSQFSGHNPTQDHLLKMVNRSGSLNQPQQSNRPDEQVPRTILLQQQGLDMRPNSSDSGFSLFDK